MWLLCICPFFISTIAQPDVLTQLHVYIRCEMQPKNAILCGQECYMAWQTALYLSACVLGTNSHTCIFQ